VKRLAESVRLGSRQLEAAGWDSQSAWLDAELLARSILGWNLTEWLTRQDRPATEAFLHAFDAALTRRRAHEPVAYITGTRDFYGRSFAVSPAVLIPRPETELLVDGALAALRERRHAGVSAPDVIDIGTGSGILAVTIALESPEARLVATDVSDAALTVAAANATRFGVADHIAFRQTSLLGNSAGGTFDLVVSNPPYVGNRDRTALMPDVRDYEPGLALFGGDDGLDVIRALLPAGGWLLVEIGAGQSDDVAALLESSTDLTLIKMEPDLAGIPRVMVARRETAGSSLSL
jgi:release factor glutamine methyltransferase